jgi:hypothetical protein
MLCLKPNKSRIPLRINRQRIKTIIRSNRLIWRLLPLARIKVVRADIVAISAGIFLVKGDPDGIGIRVCCDIVG